MDFDNEATMMVSIKQNNMQDKKSIDKFFQTQNINIRKTIREIDMGYDSINANGSSHGCKKGDVNILVVGPPGSGKSTLLRTMHYALNGNLSCYVQNRNSGQVCYNRVQIKKNKRLLIQGLTKVKQSDEKLGVYGYQVNFNVGGSEYISPMDKYARSVQLMNNRSLGCISHSQSSPGLASINFVIICLNMVQKFKKEEVTALRFFIGELQEKKLKFIIVGTHLDAILSRNTANSFDSQVEQQKLTYVQQWKHFVQSELCPKLFVQIYCMQNYGTILRKEGFENSQAINYYSLSLLDKCIKKAPQSDKAKKTSLKFFCF